MKNSNRLHHYRIHSSSSLFAIIAIAACSTASAQETTQEQTISSGSIKEIVVTAQKREENAQDVPISILAIGSEELSQRGLTSTNDLPLIVPGFQISSSAQNQLYYLRGVGSQQVGMGRPPEVATIVDGVYMPFASSALQGFNNIESVVVSKGPQGTLFGRNTTGGVIQINTKDPEYDLGGEVSLGYGNYDHIIGQATLNFGLTDNIAGNIALLADDQMDGYGKSITSGKDVFKRSIYSMQSKWLLDISDRTQLRFSGSYSRVKGDAGSAISPAEGVNLWNQITNTQLIIPGYYDTAQNAPTFHRTKSFSISGKLNHEMDWADFTSITAYQGYNTKHFIDFDGAPQVFLPIDVTTQERVFTQELQLSSPNNSSFIWTVGAFFLNQTGRTTPFRFGSPFAAIALPFGIPMGDSYEIRARNKTTSISGYGQATVNLLEDTHLTLGFRFTHDEIKISGFGQIAGPSTPVPVVLPPTVGRQKITTNEPTYRIALDHDFTPDVKIYASYNRGFQSGGFNSGNSSGFTAAANPPLRPEFIDAYEVGLKTDLFDRHVRFNLAGFLYDYKNLQQQSYVGGTLQTLNAGAARIKGIDFELIYAPSSNFTIGLVGEVLDAKFTKFLNAPGYTYPQGFGVGPLVPTPIPDAKGNYLSFAPKYTGTLYANHALETRIGTFKTNVNVSYSDGYYVDPGNLYKEPSYTLVNVSEEWFSNESFSLRFWVKNLFDEKYDQSVAAVGTVGFTGNTPGAPREYGLTARFKF